MARKIADVIKSNLAKKKQTRIAFNASSELSETITRYRKFYRQTQNEEITEGELITSILESVFRREKEFQKWLRTPSAVDNKISHANDNGSDNAAASGSPAGSTDNQAASLEPSEEDDDKLFEDPSPNSLEADDTQNDKDLLEVAE